MSRKLGWIAVALALSVSSMAAPTPASLSGYVRNSAGIPQMGAIVEIFAAGPADAIMAFTDFRGFYQLSELPPGTYQVKVSAPSFLPTLREDVVVRAGAHLVVNLTLNTLSEALQMLPAKRVNPQDDDAWRWTLRSVANRPILRIFDGGPVVVTSEQGKDHALKAQVAFVAGSDNGGFGSASDMSTQFQVEQSLFSSGTLALDGNVGYGSGSPVGVVRASYSHQFDNGSHPQFSLTMRHFGTPDTVMRDAALDALTFSVSDGIAVSDFLELNYGGDAESIQFRGRASAFRPFGGVTLHVTPNTVVRYQYATSEPSMRPQKGFETAPADLSESGPRVTLSDSAPMLERAQHHELSISRRLGKTNLQLAGYSDRITNTALIGVGFVNVDSGDFLPDVYSGTFSYNGGELSTRGLRAVVERRLSPDLVATLDYAFGGVIDLDHTYVPWQTAQSSLHTVDRQAIAIKLAGDAPRCKTHWIASYRWTNGQALTPVDLFNASPGQADPYLSLFIRQPIPATSFLPGKLEALVDIRNLLAQGYVPVFGLDGQTVYLVQTARSVRGGLAFTF
jgi:hypothetical protein